MDNDKYIGRLLDNRYEILEVIGVGGMAVVYKARCHRLNRLVAVKILKDDYSQDDEFRRRFHAEGQAVAMVSHPNIVSVYDVSSAEDADYIVMELIDGISLKQYMEKKGVLNWKETLHFAIQIGKALEHAHSRGIVHRDIKPHNVMVLKNGSVKVADFGIARVMSESNTLTREALGSVHYISPEQAKGGRVDNRSDIYSLGVVMYEMMTGRPPYNGESPVAVAIQHINGGAAMPSTLNPNIPGGLEQIIMKAMAHDPGQRYNTATAMLYDMDEFRKNPAMLFDYNTPPTDAVIHLGSAAAGAAAVRTTADRVVGAAQARRPVSDATGRRPVTDATGRRPITDATGRRPVTDATGRRAAVAGTAAAAAAQRRRPQTGGTARRRPEQEEENRTANIAVIACVAVALIALIIFLVVVITGGLSSRSRDMVVVPKFLGEDYDALQEAYAYNTNIYIKLNSEKEFSYSEDYEKGQVMAQTPAAGKKVAKGTVVYVTISMGEEPDIVYMENHAGKSLDEVRGYLDALKLDLQVEVEEEAHKEVEEGLVIRTDPAEGTLLNKGDKVTVYVSTGKEVVEMKMEDFTDKPADEAIEWLNNQKLDLVIKQEVEDSNEVVEGNVIRTDPAAGKTVKTGDTVTIFVAKGMKKGLMNVSVAGLTEEEAQKALSDLQKTYSLTIKVAEEYDKTVAEGKVIRSQPSFNETIKTGDTITLYICGAEKIQMPNVVGEVEGEAKAFLRGQGFDATKIKVVKKTSDKPSGTVIGQSVEAGSQVAVTAEITLEVSSGTKTKEITVPLNSAAAEPYNVRVVCRETGAEVLNQEFAAGVTEHRLNVTGWGEKNYDIYLAGNKTGTVTVNFDS